MTKYEINGKIVEFDASKTYLDFYLKNKQPQLIQIDFSEILELVQSGESPLDDKELRDYMLYLRRWKTDAPRKRDLREMRISGMCVATSDVLFEQDGGEEIIDNLENTGVFADYFLNEVYGE